MYNFRRTNNSNKNKIPCEEYLYNIAQLCSLFQIFICIFNSVWLHRAVGNVYEMFEDIKGVTRNRKSRTEEQHNNKTTSNHPQHTTQKTKNKWYLAIQKPTKTGFFHNGELTNSCSNRTVKRHKYYLIQKSMPVYVNKNI